MNAKVEIVKKWIEKGDHDLGTAILTHKYIPIYHDTIAFHCQQATEKYLKSYLFFLGIEFRRFHNLIYLAELINEKDKIEDDFVSKLAELEDYSVEIRYPDIEINLSDDEIQNAIIIAKEVRAYVTIRMNIKVDYEDMPN